MTTPLSKTQLAEIAAREAAATKGPWGIYDDGTGRIDIAADLEDTGHGYTCRRGIAQTEDEPIDNDPDHANWDADTDLEQIKDDAAFIAHAREDVPALLAEVERQAARIAELETALDDVSKLTSTWFHRAETAEARVAELEAERHTTNEALSDAAEALREKEQRLTELETREATVAEFVAKRAEYITAIRNCHPDNGHDYDRWQGHAAARRQLAEALGLPVAWPAEDETKAVSK